MKRILAVDDDPEILELVTTLLQHEGFSVVTTRQPKDVPHLLQSLKPDLVITDLHMPETNGFELLKTVKEVLPETPVLMYSGMATTESKRRAEQFGVDLFLDKTIPPDLFVTHVKTLLEKSEQLTCRALVADDHSPTRDFVADLLTTQGWTVERAANGEDALQRIRTTAIPFDIAFIDIIMPKLGGIPVIRATRSLSPVTLCIAMTGEAVSEEINEAYRQGAFAVLRKPLEPDTIKKQLPTFIEECRKLKKLNAGS